MKIDGIDGDATAKGHDKWITLNSVTFGVDKSVVMKNGIEFDRQVGSPRFQQVEITKKIDVASPYLFEKSCASDKAFPQVIIHECRGQDSITPFASSILCPMYLLAITLVMVKQEVTLKNHYV